MVGRLIHRETANQASQTARESREKYQIAAASALFSFLLLRMVERQVMKRRRKAEYEKWVMSLVR